MTTNLTPAEILTAAADLVEFSGRWVNRTPSGREICVETAISEVAPGLDRSDRVVARYAFRREIGINDPGSQAAFAWNYAQTDPVVVAAALRRAIRRIPGHEPSA